MATNVNDRATGLEFFQGCIYAAPISVVLWSVIGLLGAGMVWLLAQIF